MTRTVDDELRDPGLTQLLARDRDKYERLGGCRGRITLEALEPHQAQAIDALWKPSLRRRPRRGQPFFCSLHDLDASLVERLGVTLEEALVRTGGPLSLRPDRLAEGAARAAAFWDQALTHPLCARDRSARVWVERIRATGAAGREPWNTDRGRSVIVSLDVGDSLPREPAIERSTLANEMLGDPHALDDGTAGGDRLLALLAARCGRTGERLTAGERRQLLQQFGVVTDAASATVLTLGLRPTGNSALEQALRLLAGGHVVLTLGQLSHARLRFGDGLRIRLCENPAVVLRAEDRLGAAAAPLVCTGGWPGSAVCALLDILRGAGAVFEHHGDFDWEGLAIHHWLRERYGVTPWRFDATAYREAATRMRSPATVLDAPRHRHPQDDPLVAELDQRRVVISEEALLDPLVDDLMIKVPSDRGEAPDAYDGHPTVESTSPHPSPRPERPSGNSRR